MRRPCIPEIARRYWEDTRSGYTVDTGRISPDEGGASARPTIEGRRVSPKTFDLLSVNNQIPEDFQGETRRFLRLTLAHDHKTPHGVRFAITTNLCTEPPYTRSLTTNCSGRQGSIGNPGGPAFAEVDRPNEAAVSLEGSGCISNGHANETSLILASP